MHHVLGGGGVVDPVTLASLEIVCFPEFVAGAPGQRRIDFVRLSAANPSPIAAWFDTLTATVPGTDRGPGGGQHASSRRSLPTITGKANRSTR